jgi:hypothetical protein
MISIRKLKKIIDFEWKLSKISKYLNNYFFSYLFDDWSKDLRQKQKSVRNE